MQRYAKVRYQGMSKSIERLTMLFALGKPFAQEVCKALGKHVTVQVARHSELHIF